MSDIIVHNSPENKAQVSHIYFMAQLGLILYFRETCITYSIYKERCFKIRPFPAPSSPTLWHQPTRERLDRNEWGHWVENRQGVKVPLQRHRLPGAALVPARQLETLIFWWQWLRAPEKEVSPEWVYCWTWRFGGNAGGADFSLCLQPPWWNSVAPNSFCDTAVSPLSLVRCVCWGVMYGKGDILRGFLSCSCLSQNMTLRGIRSFSVSLKWSV